MDYVNDWFENQRKMDEIVRSKEYEDWLLGMFKKHNGFSDDTFLYNHEVDETTKEYSKILSYYFSYIEKLAKEQSVLPLLNDEISYTFKLKGNYYTIDTIFGQGAITSICKLKDKPIHPFVLLDETLSKEELEMRKLVHVVIFNEEIKLEQEELLSSFLNVSLHCFDKIKNSVEYEFWIKNYNKQTLTYSADLSTLENFKTKLDTTDFYNENNELIVFDFGIMPIGKALELFKNCKRC